MPMVIDMETRWVAVGQLGGWPLSAVPTCVPYCHRQSYSRACRVPIPRVHRSARTVFIDVAASEGHCAAVSAAGHVYTWGRGAAGQLGTGSTSTAFVPSLVQSLADAKVRIQAVSCGGEHTLACKRRVTSQRGAADGPRWITAVGVQAQLGRVPVVPGARGVLVAGARAASIAVSPLLLFVMQCLDRAPCGRGAVVSTAPRDWGTWKPSVYPGSFKPG